MTDDARNVGSIKVGIYADVAGLEASLKSAQAKVAQTEFKPQNMVVRIDTLQPTRTAFSSLRKSVIEGIGKQGIAIPIQARQSSIDQMVKTVNEYITKNPITVTLNWQWNSPPPSELSMVVNWRWGQGGGPGGGPPTGGGGAGPGGHAGPTTGGAASAGPAPVAPAAATATAGRARGARTQRPAGGKLAQPVAPVGTTMGPQFVPAVGYHGPEKVSTGGVLGRTGAGSDLGLRAARGTHDPGTLSAQLREGLQRAMQGNPAKLLTLMARFGVKVRGQGGDFALEADEKSLIHQFSLLTASGPVSALGAAQEALLPGHRRKSVEQIMDELPPGTIDKKEFGKYRGAGGERVKTNMAPLFGALEKAQREAHAFLSGVVTGKNPINPEIVGAFNPDDRSGSGLLGLAGKMRAAQADITAADPGLLRALGKTADRASNPVAQLFATTAGLGNAISNLLQQSEMAGGVSRENKRREKEAGFMAGVDTSGVELKTGTRADLQAKVGAAMGSVRLPTAAEKQAARAFTASRYQAEQERLNKMTPEERAAYDAEKTGMKGTSPNQGRGTGSALLKDLIKQAKEWEWMGRRASGGPVEGVGPLGRRLAEARKAREYLVGEKHAERYKSTSGKFDYIVGKNGPEVTTFPEAGKIEPFVPAWMRRNMSKDLTPGRAAGGPVEGGGRQRYPAGTPGGFGGRFVAADPADALRQAVTDGMVKAAGPFADAQKKAFGIGRGPLGGSGEFDISRFMEQGGNVELSPQQVANARIEARRQAVPGLLKGVEVRADVAKEISTLAQRSAPLALGQISSTLAGRATAVEKTKLASFFAGQATITENQARASQEQANLALERRADLQGKAAATGANLTEFIDRETKAFDDNNEAAQMWRKETKANIAEAEGFTKQVGGARQVIRNFTAQLGGAFAGTLLYGGAFTLLNGGISELVKVATPALDILSGFYLTSVRVSGAMKDATVQSQGQAKAVAAQMVAQSGLSGAIADTTTATLAGRAAGEAANVNLGKQIDLVRTASQDRQQNGGFFAQNNIDRSTLLGTGGVLPFQLPSGGQFGGNQSTLEQVANAFQNAAGPSASRSGDVLSNALAVGQNYLQHPEDLFNGNTAVARLTQPVAAGSASSDALADIAATFNADILKGGGGSKFLAGATPGQIGQTTQGLDALAKAVPSLAPELRMFGDSLVRSGVAIVDANGKVITSAGDLAQVFNSIQKGALTPTASGLIASNDFQRRAQQGALSAQAQQQLGFTIPSQEFLGYQQNRPLPFGAGVLPTNGQGSGLAGGLGGVPGMANDALAAIKAFSDQGQNAIKNIVPPDLLNQFNALSDQLYNLNLDAATRQANLSAIQYNHQLFIAKRNLADAANLAGKHSRIEGGLVGMYERETFELQKQSTALSLQLQQRQINFNLALAGFQAPGETSEERAARQKEAIIEATYAQKQLNIAKAQFGVGIQLFDEQSRRGLLEARYALADLQRSRDVAIRVALDQQAAAAIGRHINAIASRMGVAINKQEAMVAGAIAETAQIVAATGQGFAEVLKLTAKAWGVFTQQGVDAVNALTTTSRPPDKDWVKYPHDGYTYASGGLFNTTGPTSAIMGEAGKETVAILRNPRAMNFGGGGGGITILVTGNTVRDQGDIEYLVKRITSAVERSLNNKSSLLGLRSV